MKVRFKKEERLSNVGKKEAYEVIIGRKTVRMEIAYEEEKVYIKESLTDKELFEFLKSFFFEFCYLPVTIGSKEYKLWNFKLVCVKQYDTILDELLSHNSFEYMKTSRKERVMRNICISNEIIEFKKDSTTQYNLQPVLYLSLYEFDIYNKILFEYEKIKNNLDIAYELKNFAGIYYYECMNVRSD